MTENIFHSKGNITGRDREKITGHKGMVFWLFGLSGSGKSALSRRVEEALAEKRILSFRLDGDNLRCGLNSDLGFSREDRIENIRRAAETAKLIAESGSVVIATFITPFVENRKTAGKILGSLFRPVYIKCRIDTCMDRDPKGLYKKASNGEIKEFTGISSPFEEPENDMFTINTDVYEEEQCTQLLLDYILDNVRPDGPGDGRT